MPIAMSAVPNFKFGCDPELFILDPEGNPVCADGLIPGDKDNPYKVERGAVQVDGFAAEFNIDPASSFAEFSDSIDIVVAQLKAMLPPGYCLTDKTTMTFSEKAWEEAPSRAKVLGCSPDFNAWTGQVNPPPDVAKLGRTRHLGGHIHIGWRDDGDANSVNHVKNCNELVQQLDWSVGAWSVTKDQDKKRRQAYGKAGACRYKPYGVEYRVLSPFWVLNYQRRVETWNRVQMAIMSMRKSFYPEVGYEFNSRVVESIDTASLDKDLKDAYYFPIQAY
jgi:hypothetical protein